MDRLLKHLRAQFPDLTFTAGSGFYWSPYSKDIVYKAGIEGKRPTWSLLHETGHALLDHRSYKMDFELVMLETAAWQRAASLAAECGMDIDNDHIQDCLDTYRDWLYARSTCPHCGNKGIQQSDARHYHCFNCSAVWKVAPSRFCRAYRMVEAAAPKPQLAFDRSMP